MTRDFPLHSDSIPVHWGAEKLFYNSYLMDFKTVSPPCSYALGFRLYTPYQVLITDSITDQGHCLHPFGS